jgi:predicted RNA-binding Zn ribbon-like protein
LDQAVSARYETGERARDERYIEGSHNSRENMGDAGRVALIGGHLALDFANTAGWHASAERLEHLSDYGELVVWAEHAGALADSETAALVREGKRHPERAGRALEHAVAVREAIYRIFAAISQSRSPAPGDLAVLHQARIKALRAATPQWRADAGLELRWTADPPDLLRPLYPIAIAAGELLESESLTRLRQCGNHPCGWLFLDRSRNGSRRWCSSDECGNVSRVRRFRERAR